MTSGSGDHKITAPVPVRSSKLNCVEPPYGLDPSLGIPGTPNLFNWSTTRYRKCLTVTEIDMKMIAVSLIREDESIRLNKNVYINTETVN